MFCSNLKKLLPDSQRSGEVFRSGCTFTRGLGKIFYFQPGHEEYPIYYMPYIRQIINNAVYFCNPVNRLKEEPGCPESAPLEKEN